jgi:hypothetical protein
MRSYINDLNTLYNTQILIKENVGMGPNADSTYGEYEEHEDKNIAPHRDCLCSDDDTECSCNHEEDEMVFAPKNKPSTSTYEGEEHHESNAFLAKQQLYRTVKMSSMLHDIISDEEELEPWMASKITQAFDDLNTIFSYKDYQHFRNKIDHDIEIEEKTEQDLYKSIDDGGQSLISKIKEIMRSQPREKVEDVVYGMIKTLEA